MHSSELHSSEGGAVPQFRPPLPPAPSSRERTRLVPGEVIADKYRFEGVLGAGGVGLVLEVTHTNLGERMALKMLQPEALKDKETVGRFGREARAAIRIKSEHVARVIDVGTITHTTHGSTIAAGTPYLVMEYLSGKDLAAVLRERKSLPIEEAVDYVLQACHAVTEAHILGIVHRDLKPANLFLTRRTDGRPLVKVLDFGISKMLATDGFAAEASMTQTSTIIGSPLYMSPEQMESARDTDARTDIWSLGVILYELIAGSAPFDATSMPQLCAKIMQGDPVPITDRKPELPPELWGVLRRCLEKVPSKRFQNIGEVAIALAPFAPPRSRGIIDEICEMVSSAGGQLALATPLPMDIAKSTTIRPLAMTQHGPRSFPRGLLVGLALMGGILVGAIVVGLFAWSFGDSARSDSRAQAAAGNGPVAGESAPGPLASAASPPMTAEPKTPALNPAGSVPHGAAATSGTIAMSAAASASAPKAPATASASAKKKAPPPPGKPVAPAPTGPKPDVLDER